MKTARIGKGLTAISVLLICAAPLLAQESKQSPAHLVSLRLEKTDIRSALKELFTAQGVSYTLDDSVTGTVTANLEHITFGDALNTLIRSAKTSSPLTYRVEKGIYSITAEPGDTRPAAERFPIKIQLQSVPVEQVIRQLKESGGFEGAPGLSYQANKPDNSILVHGTEEAVRNLRQVVRLLDVQPTQVMVRAELVLVAASNSNKKTKRVVWSPVLRGFNNQQMTVKVESSGSGKRNDLNNLVVTPRVNGDNTVTLDAQWTGDVTFRFDLKSEPLRIQQRAAGIMRAKSGDTVVLTGSIIKRGPDEPDAELLLFLTPTMVREAGERATAR